MEILRTHKEYVINLEDIMTQYGSMNLAFGGPVQHRSAQERERTDGQLRSVSNQTPSSQSVPPAETPVNVRDVRPLPEVAEEHVVAAQDENLPRETGDTTVPELKMKELGVVTEKQANLGKDLQNALRECVSNSNGLIRAAFAIVPGDGKCLGYSNYGDPDMNEVGPLLAGLFGPLSRWKGEGAIGGVDELRIIGRDGNALIVDEHGVKAMAILEGSASFQLTRLRLIKALRAIAER